MFWIKERRKVSDQDAVMIKEWLKINCSSPTKHLSPHYIKEAFTSLTNQVNQASISIFVVYQIFITLVIV